MSVVVIPLINFNTIRARDEDAAQAISTTMRSIHTTIAEIFKNLIKYVRSIACLKLLICFIRVKEQQSWLVTYLSTFLQLNLKRTHSLAYESQLSPMKFTCRDGAAVNLTSALISVCLSNFKCVFNNIAQLCQPFMKGRSFDKLQLDYALNPACVVDFTNVGPEMLYKMS